MATIYHDVFGSIQRRGLQDERDEKARAQKVRSTPLGPGSEENGPFLNLRGAGGPSAVDGLRVRLPKGRTDRRSARRRAKAEAAR